MSAENPTRLAVPQDGTGELEIDGAFDYDGNLEHAPATSHGTYLDGSNDGVEKLEHYEDGGYHPVHLGDCLGPSGSVRYRILHKLGHGGFGTVWLGRDTLENSYVAVKVMAGDVSPEKIPDLTLEKLDQSTPGAEYIATPQDHFSVKGPNGTHQCIVLPVLGPRVSADLWTRMDREPGPVLRQMAYQTTQALGFLHRNRICHGDFRPANILVKVSNIDHLTEEDLLSLLGQPETGEVLTESGDLLPASSPRYLVHVADMSRLGNEYLTDQICVIDFGESYTFSSPPEDVGIPENYLPPEVLLDEKDAIGPACDLWALGCTLFEIRQQCPLFYMIYDLDELLAEMVRFFGMFPMGWWDKWEAREDFFDDEGAWIRSGDTEEYTLEVVLNHVSEIIPQAEPGGGVALSFATPKEEQKVLANLMYKLCQYEPGKRASVEEALEHEWFKM